MAKTRVSFKFNTTKYVADVKKLAVEGINEGLDILYEKILENSPTDTRRYIEDHILIRAAIKGNKVIGKIENSTPYNIILEDGVKGQPYNYHKGPPRSIQTVFFTGNGVKTYSRSVDEERESVIELIFSKLKG